MVMKIFDLVKRLRIDKLLSMDRILSIRGKTYPFVDYFKGLDRVKAVRQIFGEKTEEVLRSLKVEFTWIGGYMWISGLDGHLIVSSRYLKNGDRIDIYLDLIHELVHVKQFMEGKKLFDTSYDYTERPTEIEAYGYAVKEAKRIGLNDAQICQYLKTEWMSHEDWKNLAKALNVKCT
ncbi:MAG: hypothetical protein OEZ18_02495 [Candidatus Bathyarchaeota archaeon]|nr:hypothetical protein [Candidatus Bathyarchaeota archaeon]